VLLNTVRGPIELDAMGRTLMHEHVFVLFHDLIANSPKRWDPDTAVKNAVAKLSALEAAGVGTIVDLTVLGLGQNIPLVQRVADQTAVNIVAATGCYTYDGLPLYFFGRRFEIDGTLAPTTEPPQTGPDPVVEYFVRDITEGIAETGVRAAILKCATDAFGMTPGVERIVRAVARAHRRTGAPISTHTDVGTRSGLLQQRVFQEEGVDLSRVIIGHSGDSTDLEYLETLLRNGSYLGMDRFGWDLRGAFEDRVATVATLCERGHADRMVLSHDACGVVCGPNLMPPDESAELPPQPNLHWGHLLDAVVPALMERGVTEEQIDRMLVGNPRDIFAATSPY
jgi:phosphotriesterase-related protein